MEWFEKSCDFKFGNLFTLFSDFKGLLVSYNWINVYAVPIVIYFIFKTQLIFLFYRWENEALSGWIACPRSPARAKFDSSQIKKEWPRSGLLSTLHAEFSGLIHFLKKLISLCECVLTCMWVAVEAIRRARGREGVALCGAGNHSLVFCKSAEPLNHPFSPSMSTETGGIWIPGAGAI